MIDTTTHTQTHITTNIHTPKSTSTKLALITGASGGIGQVIARHLADSGYRLLLVDNNQSATQALADSLNASHISKSLTDNLKHKGSNEGNDAGNKKNGHQAIYLDITDRQALDDFCQQIEGYQLDLAFLNAGLIYTGTVNDLTTEQIDTQLDINLRGNILLNKACAKSMANHNQTNTSQATTNNETKGHIITTVSLGAMVPLSNSATYCATKSALRTFLTAFRMEVAHQGVIISGIYPGSIDTPMLHYEAKTDCNLIAFMNPPLPPEAVLTAFKKVQKTKKLETFVTFSDSMVAKLVSAFPTLLIKLAPTLEKMGKKGLAKYRKQMEKIEQS